ncbi:hypothetical protein TNCV_2576391 [Trichonephila clavipes]|uniref:Uncharacterized protein n=1 Tax=Trichonephila clavipes TaxID=2585209 RepID=A0A8X6RG89_TRICX|nr:hypothetical protein TNCV_2576391 [Trichonephila clavipes]
MQAAYKVEGCKMSLKVHFLSSNNDYSQENMVAQSEEQGEIFLQDVRGINDEDDTLELNFPLQTATLRQWMHVCSAYFMFISLLYIVGLQWRQDCSEIERRNHKRLGVNMLANYH